MAHTNVGQLLEEGRTIKASKTAIINVESSNDKMCMRMRSGCGARTGSLGE